MPYWIAAWALFVAGFDLRRRRIPNFLSLGGALVALGWLATHGSSLLAGTPGEVALAFALALLLTVPAYAAGWLGAGDVKFLAAFALMSGWQSLLVVVVVAGLVSAAFALLARGAAGYGWLADQTRKRHLPMGVFLALGMLVAVFGQ